MKIDTIHLVCSGPSAQPKMPCCVVNGSWRLLGAAKTPAFHVIGEIESALADPAAIANHAVFSTGVYMRPAALEALRAQFDYPALRTNVKLIPLDYGPPELHHLHDDVPLPSGERSVWIGSGVLALWVLLREVRPRRIVVTGLDGYPADSTAQVQQDGRQGDTYIGGEYAKGLQGLPSRPARTPGWCHAMNERAAQGVELLTHYYPATQVHFPVKPRHWRKTWLATYGS